MSLFQLDNVDVAYNGDPILKNISLSIDEGEKLLVMGPSGAGKTTLLRKLFEVKPEKTAFIHQDFALVPQLSVFHNIYAGRLDANGWVRNLRNLVKPRDADTEEVGSIADRVGLGSHMWIRVSELSGGQQQRTAVARAIYRGVDVILADEPVASVDPRQSTEILDLLIGSADTVVVTLHNISLGMETFSRAIGLKNGRLQFDTPSSSVTRKSIEQLYEPC